MCKPVLLISDEASNKSDAVLRKSEPEHHV